MVKRADSTKTHGMEPRQSQIFEYLESFLLRNKRSMFSVSGRFLTIGPFRSKMVSWLITNRKKKEGLEGEAIPRFGRVPQSGQRITNALCRHALCRGSSHDGIIAMPQPYLCRRCSQDDHLSRWRWSVVVHWSWWCRTKENINNKNMQQN